MTKLRCEDTSQLSRQTGVVKNCSHAPRGANKIIKPLLPHQWHLERDPCPCISVRSQQLAAAIMFVLWAVTRPDTLTNCIIASKPANGRRRRRVAVVTPCVHFSLPFFLYPRGKSGSNPIKPRSPFTMERNASVNRKARFSPGLPDRLIARVLICETPRKERSSDS